MTLPIRTKSYFAHSHHYSTSQGICLIEEWIERRIGSEAVTLHLPVLSDHWVSVALA